MPTITSRTPERSKKIIELWENGLTNLEIEKEMKLTCKTIVGTLNRRGLKSNRTPEITIEEDVIDQLLIGSYLGDGHFTKIEGNNSRFHIIHSKKQEEYFLQKFNRLKTLGLVEKYTEKNMVYRSGTKGILLSFRTKPHSLFTKYRQVGYDGDFYINTDLIEGIKEEGLAVWFLDDGSTNTYGASINCTSMPEHEKEKVKYIIYRNLNLKLNVTPDTLYITSAEMKNLHDIVNPFCVDSMKYKLVPYSKR